MTSGSWVCMVITTGPSKGAGASSPNNLSTAAMSSASDIGTVLFDALGTIRETSADVLGTNWLELYRLVGAGLEMLVAVCS